MRHTDDGAPMLLQSFTYDERAGILSTLQREVKRCGGWVLEQRVLSPSAVALHIEIQARELIEIYAAFLAAGLELTRGAHLTLASGCASDYHARRLPRGHAGLLPGVVASILLEVTFLPDPLDSPGMLHRLAFQPASA